MRAALIALLLMGCEGGAVQYVGASAPIPPESQTAAMCVARADLVQALQQQFREAPAAAALTNTGAVLEIFATEDGETWTAVLTFPNGTSCLLSAGSYWQFIPHGNMGRPS